MKLNALAGEIGAHLRGLREAWGLRQDDVARAARRSGLPWTRSVVMALEAGRRDLSIDEFVRLPQLLEHLGMTSKESQVSLEARDASAKIVAGHMTTELNLQSPWPGSHDETERVARAHRALGWGMRFIAPGVAERRRQALIDAYEAAGAELEQRVGRKWELDPVIVALIAHKMWGRSLTAERDGRVAVAVIVHKASGSRSLTPPRAIQALRGHITRALLAELGPKLSQANRRLRHRKKGAKKK